ncbi:16S rRNA (cytidine(1402)-2'-O)-methyltransferase [Pyruvatibacter mobilis]|uniref:Ribosomal RNA small subunit methyltransferase I n=1 Tax=Pyruvatibacter mobilis TaxID=1712261 RepID=A0A845QA84_9HYPH|nr:16S rRNA (cytidine(1402)-2'-O)-methyltransferase [Pyruvatibacter mobilis]NBG95100.1 16S rRNA (cytidine(1402)-2'-O)-methyltransferase [Pyruvatibacter mobilis]QJD76286.1 16S rRNA (cytidine(1402)-2'-O)-methyltransferase [Pyruvatibacter mobilis]GGD22868.1 ribosomal RNA small subunit methyltransferase I [Pyruvatibacter mobilis]
MASAQQHPQASGENKASGSRLRSPLGPGLHIAATPIGNAQDVSLRLLDAFASADLVLCEDTRETGKLLAIHGLSARLESYHEHNAERMRPRVLARLADGAAILLVSDAGTPLVSDPGYKLVRDVIAEGHAVTALPGPSSVLAALCIAGLPTDRFFFQGFLPPKSGARDKAIAALAEIPATLVILETAKRLPQTLRALASGLGAREAAVTRELTKKFEEARRGPLPDLAAHYEAEGPPRGEIVLVVGPATAGGDTDEDADALLDRALTEAMRHDSASRAAAEVARTLGIPRKRAYARALELADAGPSASEERGSEESASEERGN